MEMSGNTAVGVATAEFKGCLENGGSETETATPMLPDVATKVEAASWTASNDITVLFDNTENLNTVQNNTDNNEALNEMSQSNGNIHELSTEAQTNTDNEKNECLNNAIQADNNDNKEDLIRMGLPKDSLEPTEVNIQNAIGRSEIHPENIPSYARRCPDWNFLGRDSYYSMKKERQPLEKCLPIKNRYSFSERLSLQLTTENKLCVIVFENVYDVRSVKTRRRIQELLLSFPPNSFTAYYSIGGQNIEILCRYSKEIGIEHQEFGKIFEGIQAVKILSAGDFWETRGYLYDTEFFGLIESPAVDEALQQFQHQCTKSKEEKLLYDEKIKRMAAELATRSQEIREAEEARRLAAKAATANMTHDEAATSDTATTDTASSKPTVEATNDVSGLDFSDFFTPYESDTTNGEQTPSAAQESKSPDMTETDIVTELLPVNAETVTSEKSSDTVQGDETTLAQTNALTSTTTQIEETKVLCLDMESEIPDEELKKIQEIVDSVKIHGGVPRTTEDGFINCDALTDDTGDSLEVTLADFGITSCETIPAKTEAKPVQEKVYADLTSTPSIVSRLTDDLPTSPYEWLSLEGMVHENSCVPEELKKMKIWICQCGKKPWSPNGRYMISSKAVNECVTYDEAMAAVKKYGYDGVSIMLMDSNDIWCVDIDHCNKDGKIHPVAWSIIQKLNSWTEVSTSGSGFHIYVLADKKDRLDWVKKKADACGAGINLEIYPYNRHIVSTGRTLKGYEHIRRANEALEEMYNAYMAPSYKKYDDGVISEPPPPMTAEEVLDHLRKDKNGAKFIQALTSGDLSGFDTDDRSSIDFSIISKLCFYTIDPGVIREIMISSPIRRSKWDTMRSNTTYLDYIIGQGLQRCTQHYHPRKKQDNQKQKPLSLQNYLDDFSFDFQTLANVELNAIALSEFFGKTIKDVVCYSAFDKSFFIYNGVIWDASQQETVMAGMAKRFIKHCLSLCSLKIKTLENELKSGNDNDEKNAEKKAELEKAYALHNYYKSQSSFGARGKLIADVKNEIAVDHEQFDRDPDLLNLQNGTLNLNTLELQPHRASDMLTMVAAANYDPNAECPRFLQFIDEVTLNRTEIKRYLQKACGYILSGKNELHCMIISYGELCRNGKTTIFNALLRTLKDYGITCPVELITKPSGKGAGAPQPELTQLYKKRLVYFAEPEKINCTLQASLIKRITGGDNLRARNLFTNNFLEFKCTALMVLSCNNLPNINDLTLIKSDRIKIIPFDRHFKEGERDTSLDDQFSTPEAMSAILNWLIEGYKMYVSEGLKPFREMKSLLDAYEQGYDIYSQFIKENLRLRKNDGSDQPDATVKAVWEAGKKWLKENNYYVPTRRDFIFELKKSGVQIYRKNNQDYIQGFLLDCEGLYNTDYRAAADIQKKSSNDWRKPPRI